MSTASHMATEKRVLSVVLEEVGLISFYCIRFGSESDIRGESAGEAKVRKPAWRDLLVIPNKDDTWRGGGGKVI